MNNTNIYSLFRKQVERYRDLPVFFTREGNRWHSQSWAQFEEKVHDLACAFLAKSLTNGASVAILAGNIPEWSIVDIAAIAAGGVGVGIYPTSSTEQCEYVINHSDAEFLFVDTYDQYEKVTNTSAPFPKLKEIIIGEKIDEMSVELVEKTTWISVDVKYIPVTHLDEFLRIGRQHRKEFCQKSKR